MTDRTLRRSVACGLRTRGIQIVCMAEEPLYRSLHTHVARLEGRFRLHRSRTCCAMALPNMPA